MIDDLSTNGQRPDHRLKGTERKQPAAQARKTHGSSTSDLDDVFVGLDCSLLPPCLIKVYRGDLLHRKCGHRVWGKGVTEAHDMKRHCLKMHHFTAGMVGDTGRIRPTAFHSPAPNPLRLAALDIRSWGQLPTRTSLEGCAMRDVRFESCRPTTIFSTSGTHAGRRAGGS